MSGLYAIIRRVRRPLLAVGVVADGHQVASGLRGQAGQKPTTKVPQAEGGEAEKRKSNDGKTGERQAGE